MADYGLLKAPENMTPQAQELLDRYMQRDKEIDREHNREMAKLYGGAALQIGSALIPGTLGLKVGSSAIKALTPYMGKKIAENVATGTISGLASGAVEGLGRGLLERENPIKTMLSDSALSALGGGAVGYMGGQLLKNLAKKGLQGNKQAQTQYWDDYIEGLSDNARLGERSLLSKEASKYKALRDYGSDRGVGKPENTLSQYLFAGENAFDVPKGKLYEAQYMANTGDSVNDIYEKTGWFKGVDGKWRYEIPDGEIVQNPILKKDFDNDIGTYYTTTIEDLYNSPELYRNYPQLKGRSVVIQDMPEGQLGSSWGDSISINKKLYSILDPEYTRKVLEIEHTPEYINFKKYENDVFEELDSLKLPEELNKHEELMKELDQKTKEFYNNTPVGTAYKQLVWETPRTQKTIQGFGDKAKSTLIHELQHQIQGLENFARGGNTYNSNYRELAGEVEARLASQRRNLTTEQRNIYNPANESTWLTNYGYDVIPDKQIVDFRDEGLYQKLVDNSLKYRDEWVKIDGKDYRVLNLPKKDYGKILHILDTDLSKDVPIGEVLQKSDANYLYKFQKTSPTDYKFIGRKKLK